MSSSMGFGRLRSFFWPIHASEHRKFIPMFAIFFLICFNYSLLRATKDTLVVTESGAEALPFIKVWAILPFALLFTFIFTRLSNRFPREKVFYWMMSLFLGFFALFTFVLYPFRETLHPTAFADRLQEFLPIGFSGFIAIFRNWTFTAYYIIAEMWSTMMMSVIFWGFANEVTSVRDGKRYYAILALGANLATILSGQVSNLIASHQYNPAIPFGTDGWGQALLFTNGTIILAGLVCTALFRWLHVQGLGYPAQDKTSATTKIKMGIRRNFKYLAKSKYLTLIAVVVLMFNISMTLIEVVWKAHVKELFPNPADFQGYMGNVTTGIGLIATIGAFISGSIMRRFSWTTSALIPPAIFLATGVGFFSFLLFKETNVASSLALIIGTTPLAIGVFFGSLQNCLARASKYTLFDATKELSFIPLSKESRMKGKAAIDGFGSRLGKSGASVIHQGLIMVFGSIALSAPIVGVFLLLVIGGWMVSTKKLGKEFHKLTLQDETLDVQDEEPTPSAPETAAEPELVGATSSEER